MLIRLMPEQVSASWEVMRSHIMRSMPPTVRGDQTIPVAILKSILAEKAIMWAMCSDATGEQVNGLVLTSHFIDPISEHKSLVIYAMVSVNPKVRLKDPDFRDIIDTLRKFAVGRDFHNIIAFTEQTNVVRLAQRIGSKNRYFFIEFGLLPEEEIERVPGKMYMGKDGLTVEETPVEEEVEITDAIVLEVEDN